MLEIDAQINKIKNDHLEDLTTPVAVFMTFENEEGVNRALNYNETIMNNDQYTHLRTWLGDHVIEIKQASEPTDIIWENRHFTEAYRVSQKIKNVILIVILLSISFTIMYFCASFSLKQLRIYPEPNCASLPLIDSPTLFKDSAIREWTQN